MAPLTTEPEVIYPDCDGNRMADNTLQYEWIVAIQGNLDLLFVNDPDVFVAGDNLIYPVQGKPGTCVAPDVYVAFGRKKGHRGSYKVWMEGNIFPQVVFEVLSPKNTKKEMERKRAFYSKYGAEEYYVLDPDRLTLSGYVRGKRGLNLVSSMNGFKSPRLGITFAELDDAVEIHGPGGRKFLTFVELGELQTRTARKAAEEEYRAEREKKRADMEQKRADAERFRAEEQRRAAEEQRLRADKLAAKLLALGLDPEV